MFESVCPIEVQYGDCGPANIVLLPNVGRWMDTAAEQYFQRRGLPQWNRIDELPGVVGAPQLEVQIRFVEPATHADTLHMHTRVEEWRHKVFVMTHRVMRGATLICEARETRAFCAFDSEGRLRAQAIPPSLRLRCE
jgi:4-hydroxybenzoyl-CoA thioesterase